MKLNVSLALIMISVLILISIFYSSSPFVIASSYTCVDKQVLNNVYQVCGKDSNNEDINLYLTTINTLNLTNYVDMTFCSSSKYLTKEKQWSKNNVTLFFVNCGDHQCVSGRCVSNRLEESYFNTMEAVGFKP